MFNMIIYGSLLILFIILIRPLTIKRLPKDIFILLWMIVITRLLIPFSLPEMVQISPPPQVNSMTTATDIQLPQIMYDTFEIIPSVQNSQPVEKISKPTVSIEQIITVVWIAGSIVTFAVFFVPHTINKRRYNSALPVENEYITAWQSQHKLRRKYRILHSDEISTPFTYGLLKPIIIIPYSLLESDHTVTDYVLTHEFLHIKYFDILKKWLMLITLCVHWFNPLVWIMSKMVNSDIEIACDEKVIKSKGITNRAYYASILVDIAAVRPHYLIMANSFNKNVLKKRIKLIMKTTKTTFRQILLCLLIISFTLVINVTSFAEVVKDVTETTAIDPYETGRYYKDEKGMDILLLEVEFYTYETYYDEICKPLIKEYEDKELPEYKQFWYYNYGGHIIYTNDPVEAAEKTALGIKYNKVVIAKTINGKPAKDMDFPIHYSVTNNGKENFEKDMQDRFDENGYYRFQVSYTSSIGFGYLNENNEPVGKHVIISDNGFIIDQDEYQAGVEENFHTFITDLYERGLLSEEEYDYYLHDEELNAPLDYYTSMFFR